MNRRQLLRSAASAALVPEFLAGLPASLRAEVPKAPKSRVRPGNTQWPSVESWQRLNRQVGDRLGWRLDIPAQRVRGGSRKSR